MAIALTETNQGGTTSADDAGVGSNVTFSTCNLNPHHQGTWALDGSSLGDNGDWFWDQSPDVDFWDLV